MRATAEEMEFIEHRKFADKDIMRLKEALRAAYAGCQPPGRVKTLKEGILIKRRISIYKRLKCLFYGYYGAGDN